MKKTIKILLHKIYKPIISLITLFQIITGKYKVNFNEENVQVKIGGSIILTGLPGIYNAALLKTREDKEVLTRAIVVNLYRKNLINRNYSIIDIGSWIGDNSMGWALYILKNKGNGKVIAIDPSKSNTKFLERIKQQNKIENLIIETKLASDNACDHLSPSGNINHTSFHYDSDSNKKIKTTRIDDIKPVQENKIGLFHIDVEGMEKKVISGSLEMINRDKPIIIYEQHITNDKTWEIEKILHENGYEIYMINEVLPDSLLDTRNFLAIQSDINIKEIFATKTKNNYFKASIGECLIKVKE